MSITVIVLGEAGARAGSGPALTFDGTQRVVLGRSASSEVRLPDASVSHRHASLRAQGSEFLLVDEGSTNGTFVGGVPVAPRTSRIVRTGDRVRLGRVWIELRIDGAPVTRDVAATTREQALARVARALDALGEDRTVRVRVLEGPDQGVVLRLAEEERAHVVGRGADCDLPLGDADASRQHTDLIRRGDLVFVRDRDAKNGTWLGETRVPRKGEAQWRPGQMLRIGRTVLALEEPVREALARIEEAPDEPLEAAGVPAAPAPPAVPSSAAPAAPVAAPVAPVAAAPRAAAKRASWSVIDLIVMSAALGVLLLSIVGLVWLLHG